MNRILFVIVLFFADHVCAQTIAEEGIIEMKMEIHRPDDAAPTGANDNAANPWSDMEMKAKMQFKEGKSKMQIDMGFSKSEVFYHGDTKTTTTLFQAMGRKMGFYSTDADVKKMIDANDSANQFRYNPDKEDIMIEYLSETKKIAGYTCYKANIRYMNRQGEEMQQIVWYTPDFMIGERFRMSSIMRMGAVPGLKKLKGFPMEYEMTRNNGITINYLVTKVDLTTKIDDATFVIPSGYDIKPMSEMNREGGRGFFMGRERDE